MSNPISEFYQVIWTFDRGIKTIRAISNGELNIEDYAEMLYNKRVAFDDYVLTYCLEKNDFEMLDMIKARLEPQLVKYQNFNFENEGAATEYHKVRYRELSLAIKHTNDLLAKNGLRLVDNPHPTKGVVEALPYFEGLKDYTREQLEDMYEGLIDEEFLSRDTSIEDFLYYFTGEGNKPSIKLRWMGKQGKLALFIDYFFDVKNKWKRAEQIFMNVEYDKLKNSLNSEKQNGRKDFFKDFEKQYIK